MKDFINTAEIISETLKLKMREFDDMLIMGLGVSDPKRVFGTTNGVIEEFGNRRVIETPTSENAMTGVAVGLCLANRRVLAIHQRLDFFLLALDQLVNSAAKWRYMFGDLHIVNLSIRLIVGRGWGQGPTHSQNLAAWFAHIPGIRVIALSTADDVFGLLDYSLKEPNPVIIIEDRWIHHQVAHRTSYMKSVETGKAAIRRFGNDVTIVTFGYFVIEALEAASVLQELGISVEVCDLRWLKPLDYESVIGSLQKTRHLLVYEPTNGICSIGAEIVSFVARFHITLLAKSPVQIAYPDLPEPTSLGLIKNYIPRAAFLAERVAAMFGKNLSDVQLRKLTPKKFDVPNEEFRGPF